jgi:hypothetical protein
MKLWTPLCTGALSPIQSSSKLGAVALSSRRCYHAVHGEFPCCLVAGGLYSVAAVVCQAWMWHIHFFLYILFISCFFIYRLNSVTYKWIRVKFQHLTHDCLLIHYRMWDLYLLQGVLKIKHDECICLECRMHEKCVLYIDPSKLWRN